MLHHGGIEPEHPYFAPFFLLKVSTQHSRNWKDEVDTHSILDSSLYQLSVVAIEEASSVFDIHVL